MAVTSSLKRGLDLPVWEWLRFNPIGNTAAAWATCTAETQDRYIYLITPTAQPSAFWRYDTYSDGWQVLASPPVAALTLADTAYDEREGYRCRALSGSTTSNVFMPALSGQILSGSIIRILEGTGRGQQRNVLSVSDPIIQDNGTLSIAATATTLTDNTKKWKFNQWAGYQVRVSFSTGAPQIRKILYNDATNLYVSDTNYQAIDSWSNTGFTAFTDFPLPTINADYTIEASTVTVDVPWTVAPDQTSKIVVMTGGIWLISSAAAAPFFTFQYYSVAEDLWYTKTATATFLNAALGTDVAMINITEATAIFATGSHVTGSSLYSGSAPNAYIYDPSNNYPVDRYVNYQARIVSGSGAGQRRRIIGMSGSNIQVERNWDVTLDTSSIYNIYGDTDKIWVYPGGNSAMMQYHREADLWSWSDIYYYGVSSNFAAKWYNSSSYLPVGISTIVKNTGCTLGVNTIPATGGSGYYVGDTFNLTTGGTNGKGRVTSVGYSASVSSSVLAVELYAVGSGYTPATSSTTNILGTGAGLTVVINSTGSAARVTTAINHWFQRNDNVNLIGTADNTWNASYQILGCDSLTGFDITGSSTVAPAASSSISTTSIVDPAWNWNANELVGKIVYKSLAGAAGTSEAKRITASTTNTASVVSAWTAAPVNGTGRYIIGDPQGFGRDEQFRAPSFNGRGGYQTVSGTSSFLTDTSKTWVYNQWSASKVRILSGTGYTNEITIASNTTNTLTFAASQSFSPDSSSKYLIMDTFGIATAATATNITDTTKNWSTNIFNNKRLRIIGGTAISNEAAITAVAPNLLTVAITTPSTDSNYVIYSPTARGAGIQMRWVYGTTLTGSAGKYIWCPVGQASAPSKFDRYDITTGLWDYGLYISPLSEVLTSGTMYAYDGVNRLYFTVQATGRVFYVDLTSNRVYPAGVTPYAQGAVAIGNRMEVQYTPDGVGFVYIMRHTGTELWRSLIYP